MSRFEHLGGIVIRGEKAKTGTTSMLIILSESTIRSVNAGPDFFIFI